MRIRYTICATIVLAMIVVGCKRKEPEGAATDEPASAVAADVNEGVAGNEITVLTYNTHLFEGETRTGIQLKNLWDSVTNLRRVSMIEPVEYDDNKRAELIAERIRTCGADIVGLQEVWKYERQVWFMHTLRDVYPYGSHAVELDHDLKHVVKSFSALGKGWTTCGLVLLSKYPLKDMEFSQFPGTPKGNDYYARKGVLITTIEPWPGGPTFRMAISHAWTDAGGKKLTNIIHIANRTLGSDQPGPAIMMGDFNIHYIDPENYENMERIFKNFGAFDTYAELYPDATNDGFTVDFANNYLNQVFSYTKREGSRLDYVYVKESGDGLTLKPVEAEVIRDWNYPVEIGWWRVFGGTWMANYVAICSFYLDGHPYLFGLKKPTLFREGNVAWIRRINDDGRGWEKPGFKGKWMWNYVGTAIDTFELNGHPHIFALKKDTTWRRGKQAYITRINDDGKGWTHLYHQKMSDDYVVIRAFQLKGHPYLFALKKNNRAYIHKINDDGKGWMNIYDGELSSKYVGTAVDTFKLDGHPYICALKKDNKAHIFRINDDGRGWTDVYSGPWSDDFVAIRSFQLKGHPHLFCLRNNNKAGIVRVNEGGKGWEPLYWGSWASNYVGTAVTTFTLDGQPYVFALKKENEGWIVRLEEPRTIPMDLSDHYPLKVKFRVVRD